MRITEYSKQIANVTTIEESERASKILCNYLGDISQCEMIISDYDTTKENIVFKISNDYGDNGFSYEVEGNNLLFKAANSQSFVYAVYDFLETILGCRYYTKDYEFIPSIETIEINIEPYSFIPPIDYREIYYKEFEDKAFAEKHKMSPSKVHEGWGFWCHSFKELLPYKEYFNEHPEYFALINNKRNPKGEPCLSNPDVKKIIINNLKNHMKKKPHCKYWSVSQNDDDLYCQCEECRAKDNYDESQMGSILNFINEVARECKDKVISTLAYWYSRKPPKHTRPLDNVHIMVCNIEANRGLPIENDYRSKESKEELLEWSKICENVSLWDYNIQFANLVSPFPNLRTLESNMQFFVRNNVKLLFSQCNREVGGEFAELRGYMLAKLAWNPYCNSNYLMEEFCKGYYGAAAPYIIKYINTLHDAQEKYNKRLDIFKGPKEAKDTYLSENLYYKYVELFEKATEVISKNDELLLRVKKARLPLYYAGIVLEYGDSKERFNNIREFAKISRATGLEMVEEWRITVDNFITNEVIKL